MKLVGSLLIVVCALCMPAYASGAAILPPGNSAANQYAESLPGAGGREGRTTDERAGSQERHGDGAAALDETPISAQTAAELMALGPQGEAALETAAAHAPKAKATKRGRRTGAPSPPSGAGPGGGPGSASVAGSGSSAVGEVLGGIVGTSTPGTFGFVHSLIVVAALALAGAYGLRRRRARGGRAADAGRR